MLDIVDLNCRRGEREIFSGLTMSVSPGGLLSVRGANGGGKTSLLRLIAGLAAIDRGTISWEGTDIRSLRDAYSAQMLYLGHLNGLNQDLTAVENLAALVRMAGRDPDPGTVRSALDAVGVNGSARLPVMMLSQGQKRRVALALLWLSAARLWVLDEPFTALDDAAVHGVTRRLEDHLRSGGTVVLATHQDAEVRAGSVQSMRLGR